MTAPARFSAEWLVANCDMDVPFERAVKKEMSRLLTERDALLDAAKRLQARGWFNPVSCAEKGALKDMADMRAAIASATQEAA